MRALKHVKHIYYRGFLKSCNYSCFYCPFSKMPKSGNNLDKDKKALFRFTDWIEKHGTSLQSIMFVPYGEALIHDYYWEALARLSRQDCIYEVGAQTNMSFDIDRKLSVYTSYGGRIEKLRLWGTFHPTMTTMEAFLKQCMKLLDYHVEYSVGAVATKDALTDIKLLKNQLPDKVYVWLNRMQGHGTLKSQKPLPEYYQIDPFLELQDMYLKANTGKCLGAQGIRRYIEADGCFGACNESHIILGNIYEERRFQSAEICKKKICDCFLSYSNREDYLIPHILSPFRLPIHNKIFFVDIDGTLILPGENHISKNMVNNVALMARYNTVYLATSLPYEIAMKKTRSIHQYLSGGVYANGGYVHIVRNGKTVYENPVNVEIDLQLLQAKDLKIFSYSKNSVTYKYLLVSKKDFNLPKELYAHKSVVTEGKYISITGEGTSKKNGILEICKHMNYNINQVEAIGNGGNDKEMIEFFRNEKSQLKSGEKYE